MVHTAISLSACPVTRKIFRLETIHALGHSHLGALGLTCCQKKHYKHHQLRKLRKKRGESQMTGKTGEKCVSAGKYHCETHPPSVITIKVGESFPLCSFGGPAGHKTTWVKEETT